MYLPYYDLTQKPFQISPDPKFLWLGEQHKEALARMEYGILNNQGFLVLTGDVGTGKTTLINALTDKLGDDVLVTAVFNPSLDRLEFFNHLGEGFNIKSPFTNKLEFIAKLKQFLYNAYKNNKKVLLIIDEAQNLSQELLEEVRLLSNTEKRDRKLINIFFVGQDEFNHILMKDQCRPLRQRITITYNIKPLTELETQQYIAHRLEIAGDKRGIFTKKAIKEIHSFSRGYPRLINIICDYALLTGYAKDIRTIRPSIIRECAQELSLPGERNNSNKQEAVAIKKQQRFSLAGIALYTLLVGVIMLTGYTMTLADHKDYISNFKAYYGQVLRKVDTPTFDHSYGKNEIRKPVLSTRLNVIPQQAEAQISRDLPELGINSSEDISTSGANRATHKEETISLQEIETVLPFNYNTNEMFTEAYDSLDKIAAIMLQNENIEISISGYTDSLGTYAYNKKLSTFRANIVKSYLVGRGVNPGRIRAKGMGEDNPLKANTTEEGRRANRRVEIKLVSSGKR